MDRQTDVVHTFPICILVGIDLWTVLKNRSRNETFREKIHTLGKSITDKTGMEIPVVHIDSDRQLPKRQYQIFLFGKHIETSVIQNSDDVNEMASTLLDRIENGVTNNIPLFEDYLNKEQYNLLEVLQEQTRESFQKLYWYYTNVEKDPGKAFHWLKKMSWYGVPRDICKLAECYINGMGCEVDSEQGRKLHESLSGIY